MKRLAKLSGESEEKLGPAVDKLENLSGFNADDIQLISDIKNKTYNKISSLNLDPLDTTSKEMYQALNAKCAGDLAQVSKAWNVTDDNGDQKISEVISKNLDPQKVLSIKCSVLKQYLKISPPKKVMKHLKYRSLDSMLKREDARKIITLAQVMQSHQWNSKFAQLLGKLKAQDYEMREIMVLNLTRDKCSEPANSSKPVTYTPLMGAIVLWPNNISDDLKPALVLTALHCEEMLKAESSFLSANQFRADFNKIVQRLFIGFETAYIHIGDQPFLSEVDMHLLRSRQSGKHAYNKFTALHPRLLWWKNCRTLALESKRPVSLHFADVSANLMGKLKCSERSVRNLNNEIKQDLFARYLNYSGVKNYIAQQFDDTLLALEEFSNPKYMQPEFEAARA